MHQGLIFLFLLFAKGYSDVDYCTKFSTSHVLCNPSIGTACKKFMEVVPDAGQRQAIVDWHNEKRQKVACGEESRGNPGPQPPAANMMKVTWDPELAKSAQAGANLCLFDHTNSTNMRVFGGRFAVGQNLAIQGLFDQEKINFDFAKTIQMWYDEVDLVYPEMVDYYDDSGEWGHYTQVVWWNSRSVGCGGSSYEDSDGLQFLIFCNYGAGANMPGTKIYTIGDSCSQCPDETKCDSTYNGLCSITRSPFNVEDTFPTDQVYLGLPPGESVVI